MTNKIQYYDKGCDFFRTEAPDEERRREDLRIRLARKALVARRSNYLEGLAQKS